jgi:eukaryotic-like serine/threonine-protein kinase
LLRFIQFVILMLGLAVVALISAIFTMRLVIHGAEVKVPNFQGMTAQEALAKAASLGVELTIDNRVYSAEVPEGRILSQSPAVGTIVRREWHVRCLESLGPQTVAIPQLVGQPQRSAVVELRRRGLEVGAVVRMPLDGAQPEQVIAQDPPAGAAGVERPSVALLVNDQTTAGAGDSAASFVMPDFYGRSYTAAAALLSRAGLKLAPPIENPLGAFAPGEIAPGTAVLPGNVVMQTPAPGYRIDRSTSIQLTVAR